MYVRSNECQAMTAIRVILPIKANKGVPFSKRGILQRVTTAILSPTIKY